MRRFNLGFGTLIKKVLALTSLDGGFVIGVQTVTFLLCYFSLGGRLLAQVEQLGLFTFITLLMLHTINVSIIIIRIAGLNRGLKYPLWVCYQQSMRRLPALLGLILCLCLLLGSIKLTPILSLLLTIIGLPFFIIASSFIVDQQLNLIKAIMATINLIAQKLDYKLVLYLGMSYGVTLCLCIIGMQSKFATYLILIMELLLLFCHIMAITIYTQTCTPKTNQPDPNIKVILA